MRRRFQRRRRCEQHKEEVHASPMREVAIGCFDGFLPVAAHDRSMPSQKKAGVARRKAAAGFSQTSVHASVER